MYAPVDDYPSYRTLGGVSKPSAAIYERLGRDTGKRMFSSRRNTRAGRVWEN